MAILIDPPRWPAHGTVFGHLVSDTSLDELHDFAASIEVSPRAFDHDHYDLAEQHYPAALAAGATLVRERDLTAALWASGLRVRAINKTPHRDRALAIARADWHDLGLPDAVRDDLLTRWSEPGRHYHDVRHLASCLEALRELGSATITTRLAAWFHDAVYQGRAGEDEEASARLAEASLGGVLSTREVSEVAARVRMTAEHRPSDEQGALLSDADLSVLGQIPGRYHVYLRDVRLDYAAIDDEAWRVGRLRVVDALLSANPLFHTDNGRQRWETQAMANLTQERARLTRAL